MNPNDFSANFQKLTDVQLGPPPSSHEIAVSLVRRDQRRTWVLAVLSLALWILGTAGMLLLVIGLHRLVIFIRVAEMTPKPTAAQSLNPHAGRERQAHINPDRDDRRLEGTSLIHHSLPLIGGSVVALLLAAMLTVLLIFSSRHATLNKINISLAQIADQLKLLKDQRNSDGGSDTSSADS